MQEILKISQNRIGDSSVNSVSARDLHRELDVKTRFNDWFKRQITKYKFVENEDYLAVTQIRVTQRKDGQNGSYEEKDSLLTLDMAKELAMVENNEKGRKIRRYFIKVEDAYKLQISKSKPEKREDLISVSDSELDRELKALKFVLDNFNLSEKEKISYTNIFFEKLNIPFLKNPHLKKLEPVFTLTQLLKDFQIPILAKDFNLKLESFGIIEYSENGWEVLDMRFGENRKYQDRSNPKYYQSTFQELLDIVLST